MWCPTDMSLDGGDGDDIRHEADGLYDGMDFSAIEDDVFYADENRSDVEPLALSIGGKKYLLTHREEEMRSDEDGERSPSYNELPLSISWVGMRKHDPFYNRAKQLLALLCATEIEFSDIKDSLYSGLNKTIFQVDLLYLMHGYADIKETRLDHYHCFGKLLNVVEPSESVAIAMFKKICEKQQSLFKLKFQLYSENYRAYPPIFFGILEMALFVGGVHPYDRDFVSRLSGESIGTQIKEIWGIVRSFSDSRFRGYLQNPPEKYTDVFCWQQGRCRQILQQLRVMDKKGDLKSLQQLKESLPLSFGKKGEGFDDRFKKKINRVERIMDVLNTHRNEEIHLTDLLKMVTFPNEAVQSRAIFLKSVLSVALQRPCIVYNKDNQTMKLLDQAEPIGVPQENTNLLTMVYSLMKKYNENLTLEELAYYVYRGGYWPGLTAWGEKRRFAVHMNRYREFLTIMKEFDIRCCAQMRRVIVSRQAALWTIVQEDGVVKKLAYYQDKHNFLGITQQDLDDISKVEEFRASSEFKVLCTYLKKQRCMRDIEKLACNGPISAFCLWHGCLERFDIKEEKEFWQMAHVLASKEEGGRLIYNPQTAEFSWDNDSCLPHPEAHTLVVDVFSLVHNKPIWPNHVLCQMVRQNGFRDVTENDVQKILHGLAVLGLYERYEKNLTDERKFVDMLLTPSRRPDVQVDKAGNVLWSWSVAQMVADWVHNTSFRKLWLSYKDVQSHEQPACKRKRLQKKPCDPEGMIRKKIPKLYKILCTIEDEALPNFGASNAG